MFHTCAPAHSRFRAPIFVRAISLALLGLVLVTSTARAYEKAYAFVYPVGVEWERPTTTSGNANGYVISQGYCNYLSGSGYHTGTDMANGSQGGTVRAIANGKIVDKQVSTGSTGWGNMIRIEHTLTDGSVWYSQYGHMQDGSMTSKVIGSAVQMGEPIGLVGSTGNSTGAHLHLEIKTSNTDGPGYLSSSACDGGGFSDPLQFIANRYLAQGTANNWQFETAGEKEGWTTLPFEQGWSVSGGLLRETIGQDTRVYSPYMNRTVNPKLYIKFLMTNSSACAVGQVYLQTAEKNFNTTMVDYFTMPTNAGWSTIVLAIKDVPEYDQHGNFRRFRFQMPGSSCSGGSWYFSYIKYVTDNVAPLVQNLAVSPSGWSSSNSFTASWSGFDGPDDGTGYGSGIASYEVSVNGSTWQPNGTATSWSGSGVNGVNTLAVRATDKVGNSGTSSVNFYLDTVAPPPQQAYVIQTGWRTVNNFTFSWQPTNDALCDNGYEYKLGPGDWVPTSNSAMTFSAYQQGENTFQVRGVDCASNRGEPAIVPFYFDDQPPSVPVLTAVPSEYTNVNEFTVSWPPSTDNASGIAGYEYVIGGAPVWTTATRLEGALAYQEGINMVFVRARDVAGNWSQPGSVPLLLDTLAPLAPLVWANPAVPSPVNDFSFMWTVPNDAQGIAGYEYRVGFDGAGTWTTVTSVQHLQARHECRDTLFVRARDNGGNWGHWGFASFALDTVAPPAPSLASAPTGWSRDGRFDLSWNRVSDSCGDSVQYCLRMTGRPDLCTSDSVLAGLMLTTEGIDTVTVVAGDLAGNTSPVVSLPLRYDATAPTTSIDALPGLVSSDSIRVQWHAAERGSGLSAFEVQFRDSLESNWRPWVSGLLDTVGTFGPVAPIAPQHGHTYFFRAQATDVAGNAGEFSDGLALTRFESNLVLSWADASPSAFQEKLAWRGVAWGDFDGDGRPDVCATSAGSGARVFHNSGGGEFVDCTPAILKAPLDCRTSVWGDMDRDGDLDLFVSTSSRGYLLRYDGALNFADVTPAAMMFGGGTGAAWGDYDIDGWPDLFITTEGNGNHLLRNQHELGFLEVTPGVMAMSVNGRGVSWSDFNRDGRPDLYVASWGQLNHLFRNEGGGQFTDVGVDPPGDATQSNGVAWGDFDEDGLLDLFVTKFNAPNRLMRNAGGSGFVLATPDSLALPLGSIGCAWEDFDGDGHLDLYVGAIGEDALFRGMGEGRFERLRYVALSALQETRGVAWGDFDGDGHPDLLAADPGQPLRLLRNVNGTGNHFLKVRLRGNASCRDGIGAVVHVHSGGRDLVREVSGGSGYDSQNEPVALFGVGRASTVDSITIDWPSGIRQSVENVAVDQVILLEESPWVSATPPGSTSPLAFRLYAALPNPSTGRAILRFDLPTRGPVSLAVYDVSGRLLRVLLSDDDLRSGEHTTTWDGRDGQGMPVQSGVYYYRLQAGSAQQTRKIVMMSGR